MQWITYVRFYYFSITFDNLFMGYLLQTNLCLLLSHSPALCACFKRKMCGIKADCWISWVSMLSLPSVNRLGQPSHVFRLVFRGSGREIYSVRKLKLLSRQQVLVCDYYCCYKMNLCQSFAWPARLVCSPAFSSHRRRSFVCSDSFGACLLCFFFYSVNLFNKILHSITSFSFRGSSMWLSQSGIEKREPRNRDSRLNRLTSYSAMATLEKKTEAADYIKKKNIGEMRNVIVKKSSGKIHHALN